MGTHANRAQPPGKVLELVLLVSTGNGGDALLARNAVVGDSTLGAWLRSKQKVPSGSGANKEKSRWRLSKQRPRRATCCISKAWETVFALVIRSSTVST